MSGAVKSKAISVVVPVYNEMDALPDFLEELINSLKQNIRDYEIILVDDGSTDETPRLLREMKKQNERLRVIKFKKNQGQSAAIHYGVRVAYNDVIVTLDADGQNVPDDIFTLLPELRKGGIACGIRKDRKDYFVRKLFSLTARKMLMLSSGIRVDDPGCTLKIFYKDDFLKIPFFKGSHRFIPYLFYYYGIDVIQIPVQHRPREKGSSKYGLWARTFRVFFDAFGLFWLRKRIVNYYSQIDK